MLSNCCFSIAAIVFKILTSRAVSSTSRGKSSAKSFSAFFITSASFSFLFGVQSVHFCCLFEPDQIYSLVLSELSQGVCWALVPFCPASLALTVRLVVVDPGLIVVLLELLQWCCFYCLTIMKESIVYLNV